MIDEQEKRPLSQTDMRALAELVITVWPELKDVDNRRLVEGWRGLLQGFNLEITERRRVNNGANIRRDSSGDRHTSF